MEKIRLSFSNRKKEREIVAITFLATFAGIKELFPYVVFQGGNALRLCYGSRRYSNDLDFVSQNKLNFDPDKIIEFVQNKLSKVFENKVVVKYHHNKDSILHSFSVSIYPKKKDRRKIEVKLEIAEGIPAFTNVIQPAYSKFTPRINIILQVEKEEEILADKIVAMGNRPLRNTMPFKSRDVWDIYWLLGMGIKINKEMVIKKLKFYNVNIDTFKQVFTERVKNIDTEKSFVYFKNEMKKYIENEDIFVSEENIRSILTSTKEKLENLDFFLEDEKTVIEEDR